MRKSINYLDPEAVTSQTGHAAMEIDRAIEEHIQSNLAGRQTRNPIIRLALGKRDVWATLAVTDRVEEMQRSLSTDPVDIAPLEPILRCSEKNREKLRVLTALHGDLHQVYAWPRERMSMLSQPFEEQSFSLLGNACEQLEDFVRQAE